MTRTPWVCVDCSARSSRDMFGVYFLRAAGRRLSNKMSLVHKSGRIPDLRRTLYCTAKVQPLTVVTPPPLLDLMLLQWPMLSELVCGNARTRRNRRGACYQQKVPFVWSCFRSTLTANPPRRTMSGKSVAWKTLMNAKTQMCKDGIDGYHPVSSGVEANFVATLNRSGDSEFPEPVEHGLRISHTS